MTASHPDLSRRALLGGGLRRSVRERFDEQAAEGERTRPPEPPPWSAEEWAPLAARGEPWLPRLLDAVALEPGMRLLDLTAAADGLEAGAEVVRGHPRAPRLPLEDAGADAAVSLFHVIHARDMRAAGRELERVLRPGGRLALLTWASGGAIAELLRLARRFRRTHPGDARPERWGSYEGLMLALEPFPGFETAALETTWRFPDAGTLWQAVGRPIFAEAQRPDVERRLAPFLREDGGGLELRVEASLVSARRPG